MGAPRSIQSSDLLPPDGRYQKVIERGPFLGRRIVFLGLSVHAHCCAWAQLTRLFFAALERCWGSEHSGEIAALGRSSFAFWKWSVFFGIGCVSPQVVVDALHAAVGEPRSARKSCGIQVNLLVEVAVSDSSSGRLTSLSDRIHERHPLVPSLQIGGQPPVPTNPASVSPTSESGCQDEYDHLDRLSDVSVSSCDMSVQTSDALMRFRPEEPVGDFSDSSLPPPLDAVPRFDNESVSNSAGSDGPSPIQNVVPELPLGLVQAGDGGQLTGGTHTTEDSNFDKLGDWEMVHTARESLTQNLVPTLPLGEVDQGEDGGLLTGGTDTTDESTYKQCENWEKVTTARLDQAGTAEGAEPLQKADRDKAVLVHLQAVAPLVAPVPDAVQAVRPQSSSTPTRREVPVVIEPRERSNNENAVPKGISSVGALAGEQVSGVSTHTPARRLSSVSPSFNNFDCVEFRGFDEESPKAADPGSISSANPPPGVGSSESGTRPSGSPVDNASFGREDVKTKEGAAVVQKQSVPRVQIPQRKEGRVTYDPQTGHKIIEYPSSQPTSGRLSGSVERSGRRTSNSSVEKNLEAPLQLDSKQGDTMPQPMSARSSGGSNRSGRLTPKTPLGKRAWGAPLPKQPAKKGSF